MSVLRPVSTGRIGRKYLTQQVQMITDDDLRRFWESEGGKRVHKKFLQLQPAFNRMASAVRRSETLGDLGWAFPLDMQPRDYVPIAEESTSYEKADAAFLSYYTCNGGQA